MKWYRDHWYYVGGVIFAGLAVVMSLFGEYLDPVRRIMVVGYMGLVLHQFEEYVLPADFLWSGTSCNLGKQRFMTVTL